MKIYKTTLPRESAPIQLNINDITDALCKASDPFEAIRAAADSLQDGEILQIFPTAGGENHA